MGMGSGMGNYVLFSSQNGRGWARTRVMDMGRTVAPALGFVQSLRSRTSILLLPLHPLTARPDSAPGLGLLGVNWALFASSAAYPPIKSFLSRTRFPGCFRPKPWQVARSQPTRTRSVYQ